MLSTLVLYALFAAAPPRATVVIYWAAGAQISDIEVTLGSIKAQNLRPTVFIQNSTEDQRAVLEASGAFAGLNTRFFVTNARGLLQDVAGVSTVAETRFLCFVRAGARFADENALSRAEETISRKNSEKSKVPNGDSSNGKISAKKGRATQ